MTHSSSTNIDSTSWISNSTVGHWMAQQPYLWHMQLLNADSLAHSSGTFGYGLSFDSRDILHLWRMGLIKADLVSSARPLRRKGLMRQGQGHDGKYIYSDERDLRSRRPGQIGLTSPTVQADDDVEPLFHPFRYFVLYRIDWVLSSNVHRMMALRTERDYMRIARFAFARLSEWLRTDNAAAAVERWNHVAELTIATEPCFYERVVGGFISVPDELIDHTHAVNDYHQAIDVAMKNLRERIDEHRERLKPFYLQAGIDELENVRQELCTSAESLDPNKELHTLIRLVQGDSRVKLRGPIGGCMVLLTMAEILRRQTEYTFAVQLREEDERGFGWIPQGVKQHLYGSERLLDGVRAVEQTFIRQFGLSAGLRLRWYVEGKTESAALRSVFDAYGFTTDVDIVDVQGRVVEKGIHAFLQSLRDDQTKHVYSFISLDADRKDNIRAVRRAVDEGTFFGRVFISEPDFEFGNFERSELEEVIWGVASQEKRKLEIASQNVDSESRVDVGDQLSASKLEGFSADERAKLRDAIAGCSTGKELESAVAHALPKYMGHFHKGDEWGIALMEYAWLHPRRPDGNLRPIIEAVRSGFQACEVNYERMRQDYLTDVNSGRFVERKTLHPDLGT